MREQWETVFDPPRLGRGEVLQINVARKIDPMEDLGYFLGLHWKCGGGPPPWSALREPLWLEWLERQHGRPGELKECANVGHSWEKVWRWIYYHNKDIERQEKRDEQGV